MSIPTDVALVDDHTLLTQALSLALTTEGLSTSTVPLPAGEDTPSLLAAITDTDAGLILLGLNLGPAGDATPLIGPLTRAGRTVLVLTGTTDPARWGQCLAHGAHSVLAKSASLTQIITAIHQARRGEPGIDQDHRHQLIQTWNRLHHRQRAIRTRLDRLSPPKPRYCLPWPTDTASPTSPPTPAWPHAPSAARSRPSWPNSASPPNSPPSP